MGVCQHWSEAWWRWQMDTPRPLPGVRQELFPDDLPGAPLCPLPSLVLLTLMTPSWSTPRLPLKDRVGFKPLRSHCHNSHHDPDKQVGCCVTSTKPNRNPRPGKMGRVCRGQGHPTQEGAGGGIQAGQRPSHVPWRGALSPGFRRGLVCQLA